jgi:cytoskeletal protein RodZ
MPVFVRAAIGLVILGLVGLYWWFVFSSEDILKEFKSW